MDAFKSMNHTLLDALIFAGYLVVIAGALYNIVLGVMTFRKRLKFMRQKRHEELLRTKRAYRRQVRESEKLSPRVHENAVGAAKRMRARG
jgi:hypothetical protein